MSVHLRAAASLGLHSAGPSDQGDPWQTRGACRDADPELFFTNGRGRPSQAQEKAAQSVCRRCPVQRECGSWAVETNQEYGVWGGMTEAQLHKATRARRPKPENRGAPKQPCGTWASYQRHLRAGESIDDACRRAQIEHSVRYAKKREAQAASKREVAS